MKLHQSRSPSSTGANKPSHARSQSAGAVMALCLVMAGAVAAPHAYAAVDRQESNATSQVQQVQTGGAFWQDSVATSGKVSAKGAVASVQPRRFRALTLDRSGLMALAKNAPMERSDAAALSPLVVSLPHPNGGYQRFAISESPVMESKLAEKHPEIKTFSGRGIDDPRATLRMDITPIGFHASIRSPKGAWYIDPKFHLDDSVYASYYGRDLPNTHGRLAEAMQTEAHIALTRGFYHAADAVEVRGFGFTPGAQVTITVQDPANDVAPRQTVNAVADQDGTVSASVTADPSRNLGAYEITVTDGRSSASSAYHVVGDEMSPAAATGNQLRNYRLALVTDPNYATFFGGGANVTAAKVTLVNRITHVYEDETSIRLTLVNDNDKLNFDTVAQTTGANGACGATACYTAAQVSTCGGGTLTRNKTVIGLLIGASNYDIGHIGMGNSGGGLASLGVVGGSSKAQGCTGVTTPVGDLFAVDYVAHEMGHQFAGNHSFNGISGSCTGGNRNAGTSVEPGSGSSIMAYAGICGTDDSQPHSDAYWSQRSFDEIVAYTSGAETNLNEVQMAALTGYAGTAKFTLKFNGNASADIVRGANFTVAGIKAAIEGISGWPAGGTVTASALTDAGFTVTFGGTLAGINVSKLELVNDGSFQGYVGEITAGGPTARGGSSNATGNSAPVVTVPAGYTIPLRTPFALTGAATDVDGDTLTYMWEQNDRGGSNGTSLPSNAKREGPLFRQFGTAANVSEANSQLYNSPGENLVTSNPTRVFPDMAQILVNNTNAVTGTCPAANVDCFSEFLPTKDYVGVAGVNASPAALNFKLTARDGRGGVGSASTKLILAPGAGPFLVTSHNSAMSVGSGTTQTVTWDVANTSAAPVSTANVKISLSVDGGNTFPHVLAASVPNNGSSSVILPAVASSKARFKVEAVDNVFFDVSNVDFAIVMVGDLNGDGKVNCDDLAIVKASMGKRVGDPGFDPRADVNGDGVVNVRDLSIVAQRLVTGSKCK
ncbi:M12 family metallo-peptidase [Roseateles oligotrophus]|uniref:M12 family metallo-peptidase n=1 Tax=Roseateles oligotrophus TaxID=1769250 RepID=A0ABT2YKE6_9BURK|nr:M12 family metallo-peptidase [Roseateles oligotrophus]MCV2370519.1 M12 family metallo-peptidase [Roseateles oligotrophus]